jgi:hypothetical protein
MLKSLCLATIAASAAAFAPAQVGRSSVALNEMSKSIPFLTRPEKLDGSMVGDMGFDPMGLSDIQTDLRYARWAELKHGRVCMLAVLGMVWQEYFPHLPGDAYATTDPFEAISSVGFGSNIQTLLAIGCVELANWELMRCPLSASLTPVRLPRSAARCSTLIVYALFSAPIPRC